MGRHGFTPLAGSHGLSSAPENGLGLTAKPMAADQNVLVTGCLIGD